MKIKLKDKEYRGYVATSGDDTLTIILHTTDDFNEVANYMTDVAQVVSVEQDGTESAYIVTAPLAAKQVSQNIYSIEFSTKPTPFQEFETSLQSQSDAIDELLVMLLEE